MRAPHFKRAKWRGRTLEWYFSGDGNWYCTSIDPITNKRKPKSAPVGDGKTRDEAFLDFKAGC